MFEGLHNTNACLAFQQPHIYCTKHPKGPDGIIYTYQTDNPTESKTRWETAANIINKIIADEGGKVTCCMFNSSELGFNMHSVEGAVTFVNGHTNGDEMDPSQ